MDRPVECGESELQAQAGRGCSLVSLAGRQAYQELIASQEVARLAEADERARRSSSESERSRRRFFRLSLTAALTLDHDLADLNFPPQRLGEGTRRAVVAGSSSGSPGPA